METVDVLLVIYVICLLCVIPIWAVKIQSLAFFSIVLNFVSEQNNGSLPAPLPPLHPATLLLFQ